VILTAVSCSVYDAALLGSGPANGGHGGTNSTAGHAGLGGEGDAAGQGGRGAPKGGSSGATIGDAGMMDTAGVVETGGDGPEGGTGTGGTGGTLSTAGSGGTAGSATGGASTAGSGGTAGPGGGGSGGTSAGAGGTAPVTATGCAKLSVPIDDAMDRAHFVLSFSTAINMSDATTSAISMHMYVKDGAAGTIFNYVQDSQYRFFGVTTVNRPPINSAAGWQTLSFPVGSQPDGGGGSAGAGGSAPATGIAKTDVRRVGIEINAAPATAGWTNPTIVYIDSITVTTIPAAAAQNFTFDAASSLNTSTTLTTDQANGILWLNSGTNDTKATGVTLTWVASCP